VRLEESVVELPFQEFSQRFAASSEEVPFHRIVFFKHLGALVWVSDEHRSKVHAGAGCWSGGVLHGPAAAGSWQPHGSWHGTPPPGANSSWCSDGSHQHPHHRLSSFPRPASGPSSRHPANPTVPRVATPPAAFGFVRPAGVSSSGGASPPPPLHCHPHKTAAAAPSCERPRGGVASLLAAAAERAAAAGDGSKRWRDGVASPELPTSQPDTPHPHWRFTDQQPPLAAALSPHRPTTGWGAAASGPGSGGGGVCGSGSGAAPSTPQHRGPWRRWPSGSAAGLSAGAVVGRELSGVLGAGALRVHAGGCQRGGVAGSDDEPHWFDFGDHGGDQQEQCQKSDGGSVEGSEQEVFDDLWEEDQMLEEQDGAGAAAAELRDYSNLPEPLWLSVLGGVGVRDLCCAARTNRRLRCLAASTHSLWSGLYKVRGVLCDGSGWAGGLGGRAGMNNAALDVVRTCKCTGPAKHRS